jgi:sporulation protein YlmC with PRC-barrel domain
MELTLGAPVHELGTQVGRLAGFEVEPDTRRVTSIVYSRHGDLGPDALAVGLVSIGHVHENGDLELRPDPGPKPLVPSSTRTLIGPATHVRTSGRDLGHVTGVDLDPAERRLVAVFGRKHWWNRHFTLAAEQAEYTASV